MPLRPNDSRLSPGVDSALPLEHTDVVPSRSKEASAAWTMALTGLAIEALSLVALLVSYLIPRWTASWPEYVPLVLLLVTLVVSPLCAITALGLAVHARFRFRRPGTESRGVALGLANKAIAAGAFALVGAVLVGGFGVVVILGSIRLCGQFATSPARLAEGKNVHTQPTVSAVDDLVAGRR
jgi:hypothetical protein